jgi:hypothetical protein
MFRYAVDPDWYEKYWLSERAQPKRRPFSASLARFAVLAALLAGGGAVVEYAHTHGHWAGYQDWEQE